MEGVGLWADAEFDYGRTVRGGEPLVETIDDAMRTLYNSGINYIYFPAVKMMVEIEHNDRA